MGSAFPPSGVPQVPLEKNPLAADVLLRASDAAAVTGEALPYWSRTSTVTAPEQAPAMSVCDEVKNASADGAAGLICWVWVAVARPAAVPSRVCTGEPAFVSRK